MFRLAVAVIALAVLLPLTLQAQEWSAEQQEVWTQVERHLVAFHAGDMETAYESVHPDFVFWNSNNSVPGDRSSAWELDRIFFRELGGIWHTALFTPLTILVYDDFAVINFYVRGLLQEPGGVPSFTTIRWLNVWKKETGGWMLVANYGDFEATN
jgi:ketosteroid isomerase-like protein